ncbi:polysaccharide deacetylase family protein [Vagococcus vulneris]|uniref:NodB homology domain-containing protein n=1 Tax=Vagococcus vulneris TaxID=1977869 RepID=A0A429ZZY9_9ENTE|nr:polysaccharide deacetylase family protein [Vagococcus vulneris]RST99589.1 hypothetical protein CBF37_04485 [Vagococcus vulneris]
MKKWIWIVSLLLATEVAVIGYFVYTKQHVIKTEQTSQTIKQPKKSAKTNQTSTVETTNNTTKNEHKIDTAKWKKSEAEIAFPILMYHSLMSTNDGNTLKVPPAEFKEHMQWLKDNGYYTLTTEEAYIVLTENKAPADKIVWVTLDDGYLNNFTDGFPVLKELSQNATINYITSKMGSSNYFNVDQMKEMKNSDLIDIESHTVSHLDLNTLSEEQIRTELTDSKNYLNKELDQETMMLCYPAGRYDERVQKIAAETGYKLALTTEPGLARKSDGMYALKRVRINPGLSGEAFGAVLNASQ